MGWSKGYPNGLLRKVNIGHVYMWACVQMTGMWVHVACLCGSMWGGHMQVCVWSTEDRLRCLSSAVLIHLDLGDRVCHWPNVHWCGQLAGSSGIPRYWTVSTSSALELEERAIMPGFSTWVLGVRLSSPLLHGKHSINQRSHLSSLKSWRF